MRLRLTINNLMHITAPLVFGTIGSVLGMALVFVANSLLLAGGGALVQPGQNLIIFRNR